MIIVRRVIIYHSSTHQLHAPLHEFFEGALIPYQESPTRANIVLTALREAGGHEIRLPTDHGWEPIRAIHDLAYLDWFKSAYPAWLAAGGSTSGAVADTFAVRQLKRRPNHPKAALGYYALDATTVITDGTFQAAYDSAQVAISAAEALSQGSRSAFALCRPPGHHAHADLCGGYCFLNNAAIAAQWLIDHSTAEPSGPVRAVILDVDFHHGNGTQDIFYRRSDVLFVSIHADPDRQYPYFSGGAAEVGEGEGVGATINIPLPARIDDHAYLAILDQACDRISDYRPNWLVVSLGVDTFEGDPLGDFALTNEAYTLIGRSLAELNLPTLFVMEGGYAIAQLGQNITSVLGGFESFKAT